MRRLKSSLAKDGAFPPRVFKSIEFDPDASEEEHFEQLHRLLTDSAKRNGRERSGDLLAMLLKKRFLSSPWSFAQTLDLYTQSRAVGAWPDAVDDYYEQVLGSGASDEEEGESAQPEFTALRASKGSDPLVAASETDLDELIAWGRGYEHRPDARLTALITYLNATCRPDGTMWSNERVVIFTEYTETMRWVVRVLESRGLGGERLATISGSDAAHDRERTREHEADLDRMGRHEHERDGANEVLTPRGVPGLAVFMLCAPGVWPISRARSGSSECSPVAPKRRPPSSARSIERRSPVSAAEGGTLGAIGSNHSRMWRPRLPSRRFSTRPAMKSLTLSSRVARENGLLRGSGSAGLNGKLGRM